MASILFICFLKSGYEETPLSFKSPSINGASVG